MLSLWKTFSWKISSPLPYSTIRTTRAIGELRADTHNPSKQFKVEDFITIAVFNYPHEIAILKHRLNLEGISYYFENETSVSVAPMYSIALGGIKLKIHPNDSEIVKEILSALDDGNLKIV